VRRAHHLTYELLALDRRAVLEEWYLREEWERSHFVRWEVAFLAARLVWRDVFASLAPQEWYWRGLFECYDELENVNLLSWSRFHAGERLFERALYPDGHPRAPPPRRRDRVEAPARPARGAGGRREPLSAYPSSTFASRRAASPASAGGTAL